ncbi:MAG: thioredoxin family protein [Euryarchaeota archaeon]|nr:thioredoxin family protein [Euryarchaeota archaeon]
MDRVGITVLIVGIILIGYGIHIGQATETENIATYICLSCLGLTPSSYETGVDTEGLEKISRDIELIVFSAEWCKSCPKAIETAREIAESSASIEYWVIKYEENPEEFKTYNVDLNGLPVTAVIVDGEVVEKLAGTFKLDSKILEVIENATE